MKPLKVESVYAHNDKEWAQLDNHLQDLYDYHGNDVVRLTINKLARRAKTEIVKAISKEPLQQSLEGHFKKQQLSRLPAMKARQKDIRPLIYVRGARKKRLEPGEKQSATIMGYARDMPAIRFSETKSKGSMKAKGKYSYTRTHGKPRKQGQLGRKLKNPTVGGMNIGGVVLPETFISVARSNQTVHIMRRLTPKTWRPGYTGWEFGKQDSRKGRAPFGIVKYDVKTPMERKFPAIVAGVVKSEAQKLYTRNMNYLINKSANTNFK